jgi:hypothetical protein
MPWDCTETLVSEQHLFDSNFPGAAYLHALEGLKEFCLQQPGLDPRTLSESDAETHARLVDRRAGIEPLIGHAKHGGQLGQSRMKTDATTLAAGYAAIGGFNLRQLIRHLLGKDIKLMG